MFIEAAYARREQLDDVTLERLLQALRDEAERYRATIENYPPDRMEKYGKPYLDSREVRVRDVERILAARRSSLQNT